MTVQEAADAIYEEAIKRGCALPMDACEQIANRLLTSRPIYHFVRDRREYDPHEEDTAARAWLEG